MSDIIKNLLKKIDLKIKRKVKMITWFIITMFVVFIARLFINMNEQAFRIIMGILLVFASMYIGWIIGLLDMHQVIKMEGPKERARAT